MGSAWELPTRVGPLIRPPAGDLENALKTLEPGESWAVLPRPAEDNPNLWTPGVKYGVRPGGSHRCPCRTGDRGAGRRACHRAARGCHGASGRCDPGPDQR